MFAYSEGRLTEAARNMQFTGAPVIFVPGNSGSYKQARSFASVALRKGLEGNWLKHLDYFTGKTIKVPSEDIFPQHLFQKIISK